MLGTGTSGHDVAQELHAHGADVTIIQRSKTYVVSLKEAQSVYAIYSGGIPFDDCDLLATSMLGYPNATTTDFWFPWYDNVGTNAQVRVSNLGTLSTTITVTLGSTLIDSYSLGAGAAIRVNYAGSNGAALHVASSGGVPILSTVRSVFGGSSFYELMGYPGNALTSVQYFPWYNNTAMDSQVRIGLP